MEVANLTALAQRDSSFLLEHPGPFIVVSF